MKQERLVSDPSGAPGAMQVSFRGVDPFNTWVRMSTLPPFPLLSSVPARPALDQALAFNLAFTHIACTAAVV